MAERLDKKLVDLGLADTRSKAQSLIKEGAVLVNGIKATKASLKVNDENIEITKDIVFVGRGAHKIEGALKEFNVNPEGYTVADVGACTGGFTEYVLTKGATKVFAIDVGHDQLAPKLRSDSRVINMEGTNIRDLQELEEPVDLAVVDLSFISLKLVLDNIHSLIKDDGKIIALVKPQFEVGKEHIGKKGLVKNQEIAKKTIIDLLNWCHEKGYNVNGFCDSPITGKTGNKEYFFYFDKSNLNQKIDEELIINKMDSYNE